MRKGSPSWPSRRRGCAPRRSGYCGLDAALRPATALISCREARSRVQAPIDRIAAGRRHPIPSTLAIGLTACALVPTGDGWGSWCDRSSIRSDARLFNETERFRAFCQTASMLVKVRNVRSQRNSIKRLRAWREDPAGGRPHGARPAEVRLVSPLRVREFRGCPSPVAWSHGILAPRAPKFPGHLPESGTYPRSRSPSWTSGIAQDSAQEI